jgi:hypothetical protein
MGRSQVKEGGPSPLIKQGIYVPTDEVWMDEPACWLGEFNIATKDGRHHGRFQFTHVVRGKHIARFTYYLGPSGKYSAPQFQIYGGSASAHRSDVETVANIWHYAEDKRLGDWRPRALQAELTQTRWQEDVEEIRKLARHQTTSGRYARIERK